MINSDVSLVEMLEDSFLRYRDNHALRIENDIYSYSELLQHSRFISNAIVDIAPERSRVAILAARTLVAYSSILATTLAGRCYVPLSRRLPAERVLDVLKRCEASILIVYEDCADSFDSIAEHIRDLTVLLPKVGAKLLEVMKRHSHLSFLVLDRVGDGSEISFRQTIGAEDEVYIIFTSGTT